MQILINNGSGFVDYTQYVAQESIQITDAINVPTLIEFSLCNLGAAFVVPRRSSYVKILVSNPNGRPTGTSVVLASGFVSNEPVRKYLGLSQKPGPTFGFQLYTYDVKVTSDEWLLNVKSVPFIPAFVNQSQGQILAKLAQVLAPNFFDVCSHVASGDLVPYYQYDPEQTWADIAKTFADSSRYRYKMIDRTLWYQPFGDAPLGITYDDSLGRDWSFDPSGLNSDVLSVPPVNDAIVIGDTEPQTYEEDNFIGDGFTGNFALKHVMFEGASDLLLQEDWSGDSFATDLWDVEDPGNNFNLAGALNVNGGLGLNTSYILGNNGVELGGGLNCQHGEFLFTDYCAGIVGGVYAPSNTPDPSCATFNAPDLTLANCVAGFELGSPSIYQVPFPVPEGQHVAWAMPTIVDYGDGDGVGFHGWTNGTAGGDLSQGIAQMWDAGPLNNPAYWVRWYGFKLPPLPGDAVVQGVYAVMEAATWPGNNFLRGSAANSNLMVPWNSSTGGHGFGVAPTPTEQYNTYYTSTLGASTGATVNASMYIRFYETASYPFSPTESFRAVNPRLAVYYTSSQPSRQSVVVPSASGASGVTIQPIYNGMVQGPIVTTKLNHHYFLQTYFNGRRYDRYTRTYRTLAGTPFGGTYQDSLAEITWLVNDIDLTTEGFPITTTFYRVTGAVVPPFGLYAPINADFLNLVLQNTLLGFPPQGTLEVRSLYGPTGGQLPTLPQNLGPYQHYLLGFGFNNPVATVGVNNDVNFLEFFNDMIFYSSGDVSLGTSTIPSVGARIKLKSWEAAQSVGRVRDPNAIASESVIVGDDGVRLAILSNLSPLPRTSDECEQAAAAAITDRESTQFQGTYSCSSWFWDRTKDYPVPGRYFSCNSPKRGMFNKQLVVSQVTIKVDDMRGEWLSYDINFSPDQYLEKMLIKFMQRTDNILTPKDAGKKVNFKYLAQLEEAWLPDLQDATLIDYNGSQYTFDLGMNFAASGWVVEARRADTNWGVSSKFLIATLGQEINTFLRTQFDESVYFRLVDPTTYNAGATGVLTSRFSKKIRIQAPLVPADPVAGPIDLTTGLRPVFTFSLAQNADIRNVYGLEVRDGDGNVLAQQVFGSFQDLNWEFQNDSKLRAFTAYGYFFNLFWDYSPNGCQMSYNVTMPSVSGLSMDESTHILTWEVLTGTPTGHRIEVERHPVDPNTPIGASPDTIYLASTAHSIVYLGDGSGICKATSSSPALFTEDFQSLHFNTHPKSLLPGWTNANANQLHPMQNQGVTSNGAFNGSSVPVAGNGYEAGKGSLARFDMITTGTFYVSTSGDYYFAGAADDALLLAIGGGAIAGGSNPQIKGSYTTSPLNGYPFMFALNQVQETDIVDMKVTFPVAGYYPFEICYAQGPEDLHWSLEFSKTALNGGTPFYSGSFWPSHSPGHATVLTTLATVGFTGVSGTNVYTINHPHNPTDIVSTQISDADFGVPSKITVIPFDQFGDGIPSYIYHNMSGVNSGISISPTILLSQPVPGSYEIDELAAIVDLGTGKEIEYAARTYSVSDPGVGHAQTYYVTIDDPNQVGDGGSVSPVLTSYCDTDNSRYLSNPARYFFVGKIIVTHAGGNTGSLAGPDGVNQTLVVLT